MKSILQFMYLGQATFFQERMNEFLNVAKSLEIKEISKDICSDTTDTSQDQSYDDIIESNIGDSQEEDTIVNPSNDEGVVEHMDMDTKVISHMNEAGQYPCNKCDKQFSNRSNLWRHNNNAHECIKFPCNHCPYRATTKQFLVIHIQSIHEGIKFPCKLCDFKASTPQNLNRHMKIKH